MKMLAKLAALTVLALAAAGCVYVDKSVTLNVRTRGPVHTSVTGTWESLTEADLEDVANPATDIDVPVIPGG